MKTRIFVLFLLTVVVMSIPLLSAHAVHPDAGFGVPPTIDSKTVDPASAAAAWKIVKILLVALGFGTLVLIA